ncbi:MAG TPA: zinc ribbon domain-containing protein [bacterium]|nr:zinc ribbon domain-containing protein [bacterium]
MTHCPECGLKIQAQGDRCPLCGRTVGEEKTCPSCGAPMQYEPEDNLYRCPHCAAVQVTTYTPTEMERLLPHYLPFTVAEPDAKREVKHYLGLDRHVKNIFGDMIRVKALRRVYLPYWVFSVEAVTRSPQGVADETYKDNIFPAFDDRAAFEVRFRDIWPYELSASQRLSSKTEDEFDALPIVIDAAEARRQVAHKLEKHQLAAVRKRTGDETIADDIETTFRGWTLRPLFVPAWEIEYDYVFKSGRLLINGQTGAVTGNKPSIALIVIIALFLALFFGLPYGLKIFSALFGCVYLLSDSEDR